MKTNEESFEDIIFENRNKEYGAYDLRRKYSKRGTIAMIIALVIVSFAVGGPLIAGIMNHIVGPSDIGFTGTVELTDIPKDKPEVVLPPPLPPAPVNPIRFITPKIVNELTEPDGELAPMDIYSKYANSGEVDTTSKIVISDKHDDIITSTDNEPFQIFQIQEKPIFPGGDSELIKFVAENTKYPIPSQEQGIEGTVYIRFVVTKTGEIGNAVVMRQMDPLLDEEALRVVKTLPKWTPGKNNGNPVNVWFIIPVKFKLQKQ
jgi:periplasmic protein TonB